MKYDLIRSAINDSPWAILREKGDLICQIVAARAHGVAASKEEIQAALKAARPSDQRIESAGLIAVIPVFGTIMHRADMMSDFSGGTNITTLRKTLRAALANPDVGGILMEFDSPGGSVDGLPELAAELAAARQQKPVFGLANTMAASAAYWLLAQLEEVAVVPSGVVGSVGVYMSHADWSSWNEKEGVKVTYIAFGENKVEGNSDSALSEETVEYWQSQVDKWGKQFVDAVAAGRGVSVKTVLEKFGQGRVLMAEDALAAKMVDRIATYDEMVARLSAKIRRNAKGGARAGAVAECQTCGGTGLKPERFMSDPQGQEPCPDCATAAQAQRAADDADLIAAMG